MNLITRLYPGFLGGRTAIGLLLLRLVFGLAFVLHGYGKIIHPTTWMGDMLPGFLQALAAIAEFGGGLAMILGLLTPLAALGLIVTMGVATFAVHMKSGHPFVSADGGPSYELALVYLVISILFLLAGPGIYSVDALLFKRRFIPSDV